MSEKLEKKVINLRDKVTVYGAAKGKHVNPGKPIKVHPVLAAKLIDSGKATEKAPRKNEDKE